MGKTFLQQIKQYKTKWYNIKSLIDANTTFRFLTGARKAGKTYWLRKNHL